MDEEKLQAIRQKVWDDFGVKVEIEQIDTITGVIMAELEMATKELIEKAASYLMIVNGDLLNPDEDVDQDEWMYVLSPMERIQQVSQMLEDMT